MIGTTSRYDTLFLKDIAEMIGLIQCHCAIRRYPVVIKIHLDRRNGRREIHRTPRVFPELFDGNIHLLRHVIGIEHGTIGRTHMNRVFGIIQLVSGRSYHLFYRIIARSDQTGNHDPPPFEFPAYTLFRPNFVSRGI